jgi:hypothetical protein
MAARALVTLILCHSVVAVPHATRKLAEGEGYGDSDSDGDGYSFGEGRGGGYGKGYGGGADTEPCSGPGAVLSAQSGSPAASTFSMVMQTAITVAGLSPALIPVAPQCWCSRSFRQSKAMTLWMWMSCPCGQLD